MKATEPGSGEETALRSAERPVITEFDGEIAQVGLNRPDRLNAVNLPLYRDLTEALTRLASEPSLRSLILTGTGRAFCVGADLKSHGERPPDPAWREEYVGAAQDAARSLQRFPRGRGAVCPGESADL